MCAWFLLLALSRPELSFGFMKRFGNVNYLLKVCVCDWVKCQMYSCNNATEYQFFHGKLQYSSVRAVALQIHGLLHSKIVFVKQYPAQSKFASFVAAKFFQRCGKK